MKTFPVMVDLSGRRCLVVGCGPVGVRKAEALAAAGARVLLADPGGGDALPGVELLARPYEPDMTAGAVLVFACTDDAALNARVAADARAAGAWVNVADEPALCDFYSAATCGDGDVVIAVGTGGTAPALAGQLCRDLAAQLPEKLGAFAAALAQARGLVHARTADPAARRRVLKTLAGDPGRAAFSADGPAGLARLAEELIEAT